MPLPRALRYRLHRFKRLQGSIHSLSLGAAIGAAIGITPTIPLHSVLILAATLACRSNPIAGILAATVVSNAPPPMAQPRRRERRKAALIASSVPSSR